MRQPSRKFLSQIDREFASAFAPGSEAPMSDSGMDRLAEDLLLASLVGTSVTVSLDAYEALYDDFTATHKRREKAERERDVLRAKLDELGVREESRGAKWLVMAGWLVVAVLIAMRIGGL